MNRLTRIAALSAFAAILGLAPAASAVTIQSVFKGTVSQGSNDNTGLFGPVHGDLTGKAFTATYRTELTPANTFDNGVNYARAWSGSDLGQPELITAVLRINGVSVAFSGAQAGSLNRSENLDNDEFSTSLLVGGGSLYISVYNDFLSSHTLTDPFSFDPGYEIGGGDLALADNNLGFSITSVSSDIVPEPATWALMIGGFGLAGAKLRRRRVAASA